MLVCSSGVASSVRRTWVFRRSETRRVRAARSLKRRWRRARSIPPEASWRPCAVSTVERTLPVSCTSRPLRGVKLLAKLHVVAELGEQAGVALAVVAGVLVELDGQLLHEVGPIQAPGVAELQAALAGLLA